MTLEEAQKQVDTWIQTVGVRYFSELTNMAMLTEEVGEVARIKNNLKRSPISKKTWEMKWPMCFLC